MTAYNAKSWRVVRLRLVVTATVSVYPVAQEAYELTGKLYLSARLEFFYIKGYLNEWKMDNYRCIAPFQDMIGSS